jgi:hypothetical protein
MDHYKSPTDLKGFKLKGTHELLLCADDVNVLDENMDVVKKNTEAVLQAAIKLV